MRRLGVLGGGESGVGAALLGIKKGYQVLVSDHGTIQDKYKDVLRHNEIEWEENQHDLERLLQSDIIVKSPGIPDTVSVVVQLKASGISVISEI